jgi:Holliday junction resolvase
MSNAVKGRRQEHRSRDVLEAAGYTIVRAAGSKGNGWDLVGWNASGLLLCSVKSRSWPSPEDRRVLAEQQAPPGTQKIIHRWRVRARQPDVMVL